MSDEFKVEIVNPEKSFLDKNDFSGFTISSEYSSLIMQLLL